MNHKFLRGIDSFIVILLSFLYLKDVYIEELTTFQLIVISIIIGSFFYALMKVPFVGAFLQIVCTLLWEILMYIIFPINEWTNNSRIWEISVAIFMFLIFLALHGGGFTETLEYIKERKKKKQETLEIKNSIPLNSYQGRFTKAKNEFHIYNMHLGGAISSDLITAINAAHTAISQLDTLFAQPDLRIPLVQTSQIEQLLQCIEKTNSIMQGHYNTSSKQTNKHHIENDGTDSDSNNHFSKNSIDEALFSGCSDRESLSKRYHHLMKTFHPDNQNGDLEMTQKIQQTYEALLKRY